MMQRLLIAVLTVAVFGAGFAAHLWTERARALPPPPAAIGSEFLQGSGVKPAARPPIDRAAILAEIEKLRPQIDAYRARVEAMDAEADQAFVAILNPEQRRIYDAKRADAQKRHAEDEAKAAAAPPRPPLSDEEIAKLRQRPFESAFWKICFTDRLERSVRDYKLDAKQQEQARAILAARRDKFVALVDSTPPPTFKLTSLAASVQRLVDPRQVPAPPPK